MERMIEIASLIDVSDELGKIEAPTLVAHAKLDGNAPLAAGEQIAATLTDSRFLELDSANHILLDTEPAWHVFTGAMREFLEG